MSPIRQDGLRYGAVAAGALALGAAATAGADKLISGGDIADGTISKRDLAPKAASGGESLLASSINSGFEATDFVAPGTDYSYLTESGTAFRAPSGFTARGLAVRTHEGKGSFGISDVTVKLRIDESNTSIKCTTDSDGFCKDTGTENFGSGDLVALQVVNDNSKFSARVIMTLAVEEN